MVFKIWAILQTNFKCFAPRRDNPSTFSLRGRPEYQLWRRHQNLFLLANQDDLTPEWFYYLGIISELKRFFWHIGNHWNCKVFGDLPFTIGFALRITWTFIWYGWNTCVVGHILFVMKVLSNILKVAEYKG